MKKIKKQFWFDQETAELLESYAKKTGLTQSSLVRALVKGYQPKEKPGSQFYDCMRKMYGISNNMNQLAVIAHRNGFIDHQRLVDELTRLDEFMLMIEHTFLRPANEPLLKKGDKKANGKNS